MAKNKSIIPGFSLNRALGITSAKQKIARATGIPTTKQGRKRKLQSSLWTAVAVGVAAAACSSREKQSAPPANEQPQQAIPPQTPSKSSLAAERGDMFSAAAYAVLESGTATVCTLQRRPKIGYSQAARLMDDLEARGIVGPFEGSSPREILITLEQFENEIVPKAADPDEF